MKSKIIKHLVNKKQKNIKKETQESDDILKKISIAIPSFFGISTLMQLLIVLIVCIAIALAIASPALTAASTFEKAKSSILSVFSSGGSGNNLDLSKIEESIKEKKWSDNSEIDNLIKDYLRDLAEVYVEYKKDGIEIDISLINATVFYNNEHIIEEMISGETNEEDIDEGIDDSEEDITTEELGEIYNNPNIKAIRERFDDIEDLAENMLVEKKVDYDEYKKYLISEYIPKRFSSEYETEEQKYTIAEEIIEAAKPKEEKNTNTSVVYEECNKVCTTTGECYDLEEFVTRVVDHESSVFYILTDKYAEVWKAQAIAARSVTLHLTNMCTTAIELSNNLLNILDPTSPDSRHDLIEKEIEETRGVIMTVDGEVLPSNWNTFYYSNDARCDEEFCYSTYLKTRLVYGQGEPHEIKAYKKWSGNYSTYEGTYGMSQYSAAYLADIGWNYKDILKFFYADDMEFSTLTTVASGTISGTNYSSKSPIYQNASEFYSNVDYRYFLSTNSMSDPWNYGECPWFAQGRALQIVANSNMPEDRKKQIMDLLRVTRPDGGSWYSTLKNTVLNSSNDIYAAKPGSIITWATPGKYGHVGIIEDVEYDSNGRATRVLVTESWNGTSNPSNAAYSYSWQTIEGIRYYTSNGHAFVGYTYLLD